MCPWSHYSRACSVGSQGEKVCSSQCSLPCLDCHFYPPHGGGPGGMSDTILLTLLPVSSGAGIPPSSSHLPKMLQGECHPLDFAWPASVDIYVFACSVFAVFNLYDAVTSHDLFLMWQWLSQWCFPYIFLQLYTQKKLAIKLISKLRKGPP